MILRVSCRTHTSNSTGELSQIECGDLEHFLSQCGDTLGCLMVLHSKMQAHLLCTLHRTKSCWLIRVPPPCFPEARHKHTSVFRVSHSASRRRASAGSLPASTSRSVFFGVVTASVTIWLDFFNATLRPLHLELVPTRPYPMSLETMLELLNAVQEGTRVRVVASRISNFEAHVQSILDTQALIRRSWTRRTWNSDIPTVTLLVLSPPLCTGAQTCST